MQNDSKLSPPVGIRLMHTADDLEDDATAIDRIANRLVDDYGDDEKLLALGRRLRRHAGALIGMAWEIEPAPGSIAPVAEDQGGES